jgi:hypothetical protein
MPIVRIHFNRNFARKITKDLSRSIPCISLNLGGRTTQFYSVVAERCTAIHGKVLNCGATAYLETSSDLVWVFKQGNWHRLSSELFASPPDNQPNQATVHSSINCATASEFAFDSKLLALNRIARSSTPLLPAILLKSSTQSFTVAERFEFDRPLQIIQSHQTLSSTLFGGISVFGITNSTLPEN